VPDRFLSVEDVRVSFGTGDAQVRALRGASVTFEPGTLSLVMGPSGSGKTTLLSLLGCLLAPDDGTVFVDGTAVNALNGEQRAALRRKKIGFVFQSFRLLHSLSALDNVCIGLDIREPKRPDRTAVARELLLQFGLGDKLNHEPEVLSPGEKQRVAIARALAGNPPIILEDEPTASLDAEAGRNICQILRNQVQQNGKTVVVVSHDSRWQEYASRTVILSDGQVTQPEQVRTREHTN
jgi:putative ABC transport system ATP-binding protein